MIVLLLLGVIWAAVLLPPWLQNRRERRPIASMRSFHRQLWLLERASPGHGSMPADGYRSVTVYGADDPIAYGGGYDYSYSGSYSEGYDEYDDEPDGDYYYYDEDDAAEDVDGAGLRYAGEAWGEGGRSSRLSVRPGPVDDRWAELAEAKRRSASARSAVEARGRIEGYRRRRRVLATLLVAAVATAVPAALLGGIGWWVGHAVADVLLASYVVLLVQRQRRTIEREEKVHYLAPIRAPRPPVVVLGGGAAQ